MAGRPAQAVGRRARRRARGRRWSGPRRPPRAPRRTCPATSGAAESRPQKPARPAAWSGSRTSARDRLGAHALEHRPVRVRVGRQERPAAAAGGGPRTRPPRGTGRGPRSWTAVIGASPCSVGSRRANPPSASSVARMISARSATSFAGMASPMNVSTVMSCARWRGRVDDLHATPQTAPAAVVGDRQDRRADRIGTVAHQVVPVVAERHDADRRAARRRDGRRRPRRSARVADAGLVVVGSAAAMATTGAVTAPSAASGS